MIQLTSCLCPLNGRFPEPLSLASMSIVCLTTFKTLCKPFTHCELLATTLGTSTLWRAGVFWEQLSGGGHFLTSSSQSISMCTFLRRAKDTIFLLCILPGTSRRGKCGHLLLPLL